MSDRFPHSKEVRNHDRPNWNFISAFFLFMICVNAVASFDSKCFDHSQSIAEVREASACPVTITSTGTYVLRSLHVLSLCAYRQRIMLKFIRSRRTKHSLPLKNYFAFFFNFEILFYLSCFI